LIGPTDEDIGSTLVRAELDRICRPDGVDHNKSILIAKFGRSEVQVVAVTCYDVTSKFCDVPYRGRLISAYL
jgi:hypothetical protein